MSTKPLTKLVDIATIAEHLSVDVAYVRRLVKERRIPFVKWGHYIRFDPDEVNKWIDSAKVEPNVESSRWW